MNESQQHENITNWESSPNAVIVSTEALGHGYHSDNVNFVLHIGCPESLLLYAQEIGRGGRNGDQCECILLFTRTPQDDGMKHYVAGLNCYRKMLQNYLDGSYESSCLESSSEICGYCSNTSANKVLNNYQQRAEQMKNDLEKGTRMAQVVKEFTENPTECLFCKVTGDSQPYHLPTHCYLVQTLCFGCLGNHTRINCKMPKHKNTQICQICFLPMSCRQVVFHNSENDHQEFGNKTKCGFTFQSKARDFVKLILYFAFLNRDSIKVWDVNVSFANKNDSLHSFNIWLNNINAYRVPNSVSLLYHIILYDITRPSTWDLEPINQSTLRNESRPTFMNRNSSNERDPREDPLRVD